MRYKVFATKKEWFGALCIAALMALAAHVCVEVRKTTTPLASYYDILNTQETILDDVRVSEKDVQVLRGCWRKNAKKSNAVNECLRTFYDDYTMIHGPERAFAHLARLQKEHPDLIAGCHYISHGIGHAALRRYGDDPYKAFSYMQSGQFYKNIRTCGSGYFHGVIEEIAKDETNRDALAQLLRGVCNNKKISNRGGCFHGVGHAAAIQTNYSPDNMLYVCNIVADTPVDAFACYTGSFMEYAQETPDSVTVTDGTLQFNFCDSLEESYRPACYLELSSSFESLAPDTPGDYQRYIGFCKQIQDPLNRMACVKLFAIRAVRIVHYNQVAALCTNTSTVAEKVMCTAVVADRVAGSIDNEKKSSVFTDVVKDACDTLDWYRGQQCRYLVYKENSRLFYTSKTDLIAPTPIQLITWWWHA